MLRRILSVGAFLMVSTTMALAQEAAAGSGQSAETLAWEAVKDSSASADVFAFIESYPDGAYTKEAQALMIDLLWAEMASASPAPAAEEPVSEDVVSDEPVTEEVVNEDVAAEEPAPQDIVAVTFNMPLTQGAPAIVGKTIEELISGTPLFPPVEGLPESYWKTQDCSNCHEWEQANLCVQANTYLTDAGAENLVKEHPYGGTFKQNLRSWATDGCQ